MNSISPQEKISANQELGKFNRSVSVLCWAYNEEILISDFLVRIAKLLAETVNDFEIIVIDDCSTDRTNQIVKELSNDIPQIRLFKNAQNMNVGFSCKRALQKAEKEYLFWQTIDWAYDIQDLRSHLELLNTYDVVAGVRRSPVKIKNKLVKPIAGILKLFGIQHLTKRSDTISKAIISVINYTLIRILFNCPISDYQNVVFYPSKLIHSLDIEANSSFINPELLIKSYWRGCRIKEVPISFLSRVAGEAKGTKIKAIRSSVKDVFCLWAKWVVLNKIKDKDRGRVYRDGPSPLL